MIARVRVDKKNKKNFLKEQRILSCWWRGLPPVCVRVRDNKIFYICKKKKYKNICFFRFFCYRACALAASVCNSLIFK
jgi:hypothetical protein